MWDEGIDYGKLMFYKCVYNRKLELNELINENSKNINSYINIKMLNTFNHKDLRLWMTSE